MRVIVTDGGERAALAAVRSLGRAFSVHVVGHSTRTLAGDSRYCSGTHAAPDPVSQPDGFADSIRRLSLALDARIVLPISDGAHRALLSRRGSLGPATLAAASVESYDALSNKAHLSKLATRRGLKVPEGRIVGSVNEARTFAESHGFPVIVKAVQSIVEDRSGRLRKAGVSFAANRGSLERAWARSGADTHALVQRVVPGWGEGVFVLRHQGRIVAAFAHRRLRERPPEGGVSVLRESIPIDQERLTRVEAILGDVDYEGVAMAEFKTSGENAWLIEFNARLWGSLQLSIDAGLDFPRMLVEAALGKRLVTPPPYRVGVRSRWLLGELDHALALLKGGRDWRGRTGLRSALGVLLRPAGRNCRWEVLRREDPRPFTRELLSWLRSVGRVPAVK